ncbi:ATP-grasp domain-containing protein [Pseudonocardia sp.]|uniref:carboxylate--amine ligase n=1 Tax=Pseudonocardia sp. TaxID=60912 RepID=UPI00261C3C97|nr:ATP-grasp domain-containing protein [Pseudonocardia sp.]
MSSPPVILLGGDTTALSIARSLGRAGVAVHGIGVTRWAAASRHISVIEVPPGAAPEDAWAQLLLGPATEALRGAVVLGTSDVGLMVLLRHRTALLERFRLDDADVTAQMEMLDKLSTYERAREAGVPTPLFWRIDTPEDLDRHREALVYPLIVKPLLSHEFKARFPGQRKFLVAADFAELRAAHAELAAAGLAVMLVEKIPSSDEQLCSYSTYIDPGGNPTYDYTKRVIRRFPPNEGMATSHVTDRNEEVKEVALRLVKHVGLRGLACVEFVHDLRDDRLKLIECNARFSAANPLVQAAGLDLARHVYERAAGRPHELPATYRTGLRMLYPVDDFRSFLVLRRRGELTFGQWVRSVAHRQVLPVFRADDPLPAVARALLRAANILRLPVRG